ncbi:hypothetical protein D1B31_10860 [Neobacillus notoginsengisoli]|uniref:Uncharacterized protein n=1 Tax=Neobacillus notoginsengisoli TaxID=1578198 RepID=A0A417YU32_9BACI|nr:hypothetical protein D1B31_10860 [Neobacillus notoginsengisoli]
MTGKMEIWFSLREHLIFQNIVAVWVIGFWDSDSHSLKSWLSVRIQALFGLSTSKSWLSVRIQALFGLPTSKKLASLS